MQQAASQPPLGGVAAAMTVTQPKTVYPPTIPEEPVQSRRWFFLEWGWGECSLLFLSPRKRGCCRRGERRDKLARDLECHQS